MKASFVFDRETKGTVRFKEIVPADSTPLMGTLYLRKVALAREGIRSPYSTYKLNVEILIDA